jgi:hypothetical protein
LMDASKTLEWKQLNTMSNTTLELLGPCLHTPCSSQFIGMASIRQSKAHLQNTMLARQFPGHCLAILRLGLLEKKWWDYSRSRNKTTTTLTITT